MAINVTEKFNAFSDRWQPKRIAGLNDYDVRIAKIEGEFVWHAHADTDELFLIWKGTMDIQYRDRTVSLREGDLHVVPKGTDHRPVAHGECWIMMIEPSDTVNTGDTGGERTRAVETL